MKILRELREKRGLTLEQVAEGVGLRNQYISNYELGKRRPDYDTICKLADFFGVSVDYLLFSAGYWNSVLNKWIPLSCVKIRFLGWNLHMSYTRTKNPPHSGAGLVNGMKRGSLCIFRT